MKKSISELDSMSNYHLHVIDWREVDRLFDIAAKHRAYLPEGTIPIIREDDDTLKTNHDGTVFSNT